MVTSCVDYKVLIGLTEHWFHPGGPKKESGTYESTVRLYMYLYLYMYSTCSCMIFHLVFLFRVVSCTYNIFYTKHKDTKSDAIS